jgi:ribosomal protein L37AE/L43A
MPIAIGQIRQSVVEIFKQRRRDVMTIMDSLLNARNASASIMATPKDWMAIVRRFARNENADWAVRPAAILDVLNRFVTNRSMQIHYAWLCPHCDHTLGYGDTARLSTDQICDNCRQDIASATYDPQCSIAEYAFAAVGDSKLHRLIRPYFHWSPAFGSTASFPASGRVFCIT